MSIAPADERTRPLPLAGEALAIAREARAAMRGHDVVLAAAGLTFYVGLAIVPLLLVALHLAGYLLGEDTLRSVGYAGARLLPDEMGAQHGARQLVRAATSLSVLQLLVSLIPATFYGEGLRRAFTRLSPDHPPPHTRRARLLILAFLGFTPLLVSGLVAVAAGIDAVAGPGTAGRAFGSYATFFTTALLLSGLTALSFRFLAPARLHWLPLLTGAGGTGSMIAGMLIGFLIFLALPVDVAKAYGGLVGIAEGAAVVGWLFVLHLMLLVGYVVTLRLAPRLTPRPAQEPVEAQIPVVVRG